MNKRVAVIMLVTTLFVSMWTLPLQAKKFASIEEVQQIINKGIDSYSHQQYYDAIDYFQQAFVLQANNPDLLYKVAKCFEKLNKPQNALYYYLKAIDVDNRYLPAIFNVAVLNDVNDRYSKAISYYHRALKQDKKLIYAYYNLGNIYFRQNKYQAAINNYQKAIKFDKDFADAYYNLATLYKETGQDGKAKKLFKKYSALNPSDSEVKSVIESLN